MEFLQYEKDDQTSDYLIDKAKYRPNELTDLEWKQYEGYPLDSAILGKDAIENEVPN